MLYNIILLGSTNNIILCIHSFIHTHTYCVHVACMYIVCSDDVKDTESSDDSADEASEK